MLVYLDTAQFSWLEQANEEVRSGFIEEWRGRGCELALSLHLLQEGVKRGSPEDVEARLATIMSLAPLRGIPAGSAGVMVREATVQMMALIGTPVDDPIAYGEASLFPMMDRGTPTETTREHLRQFTQLNQADSLAAQLESLAKALPKVKKGVRTDPDEVKHRIRRISEEFSPGMGPGASALLAISEGVIRDVEEADGDVWAARVQAWGLADLKCVEEVRGEDHSKAAGFLRTARDAADDIAAELGIREARVLGLVNALRPYEAPGYSIEMAVSRARIAHNMEPTAADQVDEEHVSFAPYVDLMFVDKRTRGHVDGEGRRGDGRMVDGAAASITSARNLQDALEQIHLGS